jgi:hypothetical protein
MTRSAGPRPITDSPWFWAYLFGTAALVALALAGGKYGPRQAQIEREFQGRQRAAQNLNRQTPSVELSTAERTLITLRPLFLVMAAITAAAWIVFWRRHWRRSRGEHRDDLPSADVGKQPAS